MTKIQVCACRLTQHSTGPFLAMFALGFLIRVLVAPCALNVCSHLIRYSWKYYTTCHYATTAHMRCVRGMLCGAVLCTRRRAMCVNVKRVHRTRENDALTRRARTHGKYDKVSGMMWRTGVPIWRVFACVCQCIQNKCIRARSKKVSLTDKLGWGEGLPLKNTGK